VEEEASVTNLHELRKRVKDLWYQLRLIAEADRPLIRSLADHAHDLSDHLGDDHDLALLREEGARRRNAFAEAGDQRFLFELIDQRREELQFAAISLGADLRPQAASSRSASARAGRSGGSGANRSPPRCRLSQARAASS
jgi:hypothetical protein